MTVPRGSGHGRPWALVALSLAFGLAGGFGGAAAALLLFDDDATPTPVAPAEFAPERITQTAAPAVVTVVVRQPPVERNGRVFETTSVGSGVIVDDRGFVVTNEHVVRGASRVDVVLHTGEERRGTLVADDRPFTDLAVVRIEGEGTFPTIPIGDSDALQLGDPLVAIGHSLQTFDHSITTGVVSGLHRSWPRENVVMEDLIQTDAAVNHGNSGGALLNRHGELVGMNTTVIRQTETGQSVEGIALAISSRTIDDVSSAIIEDGRKARPSLGLEHRDVPPELAAANGFPPMQAALVVAVDSNSPAESGGIRPQDLIIAMGGMELTPERPYINTLMRLATGEAIDIVVLRGSEEVTLSVTPSAG